MEQIAVKELQEYNFYDLFPENGSARMEDELEIKSDEIKRSLGLRMQPIQLYTKGKKKRIKFSGIAGVVSLKKVEIEIMPKFLKGGERWRESLFNMMYWSRSNRLLGQRSAHISTTYFSFYDHVALMFCDTMQMAMAGDSIHSYHLEEDSSRFLRGKLLLHEQLKHIITHPGIMYYEHDSFDTENAFNYLLVWCLKTLAVKTRNVQIKIKIKTILEDMPEVRKTYPLPVETKLPPQYAQYSDAIEIANNLAAGYSYVHSAKVGVGIGYVVNTEAIYEKFVEKILQHVKSDSYELRSEAQSSLIFARAVSPKTSSYYTVPDNKLYVDGVPKLLIDAKYKNIYADEKGKKPVNSDIYQMFSSLIAHKCSKGILISPCESGDPITEHAWEVSDGLKKYELFSVTVDMGDLSSAEKIERLKSSLLAYIDKKLV